VLTRKKKKKENLRNLQNDFWRLYQLQKSVGSSPNHPFSKFGTGNADTLSVHPKTRGVDVRDELLKFHQKHYSANVMGLAVIGRESLDQLEAWVTELFTAIPNKKIAPPTFEGHPLIKDKQLVSNHRILLKKQLMPPCRNVSTPSLSRTTTRCTSHGHCLIWAPSTASCPSATSRTSLATRDPAASSPS